MPHLTKLMIAAAALAGLTFLPSQNAQARFLDPALKALPSLTEDVACRTVRTKIVRPGGRVTYTTKRTCGAPVVLRRAPVTVQSAVVVGTGCRTVRERIVGPGGHVTYKTIKRCG